MKRFILFPFLLMLIVHNIAATTTTVYLSEDPQYPGPRPRSLSVAPASTTTHETNLSVYLDSSVLGLYLDSFTGTTTITVYDTYNQIIEQETTNATITPEVYIPVYLWDSGYYTLTVSDGITKQKTIFYIPE